MIADAGRLGAVSGSTDWSVKMSLSAAQWLQRRRRRRCHGIAVRYYCLELDWLLSASPLSYWLAYRWQLSCTPHPMSVCHHRGCHSLGFPLCHHCRPSFICHHKLAAWPAPGRFAGLRARRSVPGLGCVCGRLCRRDKCGDDTQSHGNVLFGWVW